MNACHSGGTFQSTQQAAVTAMRCGSGAPDSSVGYDGDFYMDCDARVIYGPKTTGSWGAGTSTMGPTGPTGPTGASGSTGATGPQGSQGIQGDTGAAGSTGATGSTGAKGDQGIQGTTGAAGATGSAGTNGTNGTNGATGTAGATGSTGAAGATGSTGPTGATGSAGATGAAGANGAYQLLRKDADQNSIGSTATDVSSLTLSVTSGQTLRFHALLRQTSSSAILGAMVGCNGPATSILTYRTVEWTALTSTTINHNTSYDSYSSLTVSPAGNPVISEVIGIAKFGASGTFAIRAKSQTLGTMNILAGSWMEYDLN